MNAGRHDTPPQLPIHAVLPALSRALQVSRNVVLEAPPGAGKSTVAPLALLDEPWARNGRILLLEPRRLAARAVAARMARSLGEAPGGIVGYRMRLDTRVSARTRLEVVTEGVLTRMLQEDPALEGVAAVIFDEFHERSLAADLGIALCLESQATLAESLRILVMSATLDGAGVAALLGGAPVLRAEGRQFDVEIRYAGRGLPTLPEPDVPLSRQLAPVVAGLRRALSETTGDILAFLPGAPEIRRVRALLEEGPSEPGLVIHELYGELALDAQEAALQPARNGERKLVLSTNVAETSLTIEGVRVVLDAGLVRRAVFDPGTGMSRLVTERVSRASATQRAGRAGRVAPGICYRLWGEGSQQTLAAFTPPEIMTADLAPLALELAAWGARDAGAMAWLDPPPQAALAQARELLGGLDAIDAEGRITAQGRRMAAMGTHPRLAHMLVQARASGQGALAARLAALLSERDLLRGARDPDLRSRLEILRQGGGPAIDRGLLARVRQLVGQFAPPGEGRQGQGSDDEAGALLAWAFPDRIAQRRGAIEGPSGGRYRLSGGRGARLDQVSTLGNAPFLVAVDLDDAEAAEACIRLAAPVTPAQLERVLGAHISEETQSGFDAREGAVVARRVRKLGALVLAERALPLEGSMAAAAMVEALQQRGLGALQWDDSSRALLARLRFAAALPQVSAGWPPFDEASLVASMPEWLAPYLDGINRLSQLGRVPLREALLSRLDYAAQRQLDNLAPARLTVPTGTQVAVDYVDDNAPCIEVRLQEVFGLAETPRIGGGRVPVTLKLLSPARRPVQITRDLGGFWRGSYADVRKDLRGRYPKHYWPENPLDAEPTRGVRR
ncbi:MAG: putative ATP-dependent helicase protein [Pseudomonadota bacterium]|jgi:ATP-dependent helicase HrpB